LVIAFLFKRIGTISGTPTAAGTATVQVTAKDASGKARTDEFTVTIEASSTPVDAKPTAVALTGTIVSSLAEDTVTTNSVKIADIAVTDDGQGTYALGVSGADASFFEIVDGGAGNDVISAGGTTRDDSTSTQDILDGGPGINILNGHAGNDYYVLRLDATKPADGADPTDYDVVTNFNNNKTDRLNNREVDRLQVEQPEGATYIVDSNNNTQIIDANGNVIVR
jgi:hypothetical protein